MFKNGTRVVLPIMDVPTEIVISVPDGSLPAIAVKIEYDNEGLHFLTPWGMCGITKEVIENAESSTVLPELHN